MSLRMAASLLRKNNRGRFVAGLGLVLTGYFLIHTLVGERGLIAHRELGAQITKAEGTLATLKLQQQAMSADLSGLEPKHVDPDRLEEQAYKTLGFAAPQDEIIITGTISPPPAKSASGN